MKPRSENGRTKKQRRADVASKKTTPAYSVPSPPFPLIPLSPSHQPLLCLILPCEHAKLRWENFEHLAQSTAVSKHVSKTIIPPYLNIFVTEILEISNIPTCIVCG